MAVKTTTNIDRITAVGTIKSYDFALKFFHDTEISVTLNGAAQTQGTDYYLTNQGRETGGTITFTTAPAVSDTIVITRTLPITQVVEDKSGYEFPENSMIDMLDKLVMIDQQQQTAIDALDAQSLNYIVSASGGHTMSREENVAGLSSAITLANEIRTDIISHFANETRHTTGAHDTTGIPAAATNLATLKTLAASLLTLFAEHNTDAVKDSEWAYHSAKAKDCALVSAEAPTTLELCVTRLNDLKEKYNDHEDETVGHADTASVTADQVAATDAAYGDTNRVPVEGALPNDIVFWDILDDGTGNVTGVSATAGVGFVDFKFNADPQNDAIISYIVIHPAA